MSTPRSRRDMNEDAILEAELNLLQKQHRVLKNDFKAFKEDTRREIIKQKGLKTILEQEHRELMQCVKKIDTPVHKMRDVRNVVTLSDLGTASSELERMISDEKECLEKLDDSIVALERKISEQRLLGNDKLSSNFSVTDKTRAVLENRLDLANRKLNSQLTINQKLHAEIDSLQIQRRVFIKLCQKLQNKIQEVKKEKADLIEETTGSFELRDEAQNKIKALKERHEKDKSTHEAEMKELNRIIAHDNRIKEFLMNNTSDRAALKAEEREKKRQRNDPNESVNADKVTIISYEDVFKDIQAISGQDELEDIVQHFLTMERENFALFNLVTEKNSECMMLKEELTNLTTSIQEFQRQGTALTDNYNIIKGTLQSQMDRTKREKTTLLKKSSEQNELLERMYGDIMTLFRGLECDDQPIREMLGASKIDNKNVMTYIGLIEKKAIELLNYKAYLKHKESMLQGLADSPIRSFQHMSSPVYQPKAKESLTIIPPSVDDESFMEDPGQLELQPLSRSEISSKVTRDMYRLMGSYPDPQKKGK